MRTFKRTWTDKKGRNRETKVWHVSMKDHKGILRTFSAFTDKKASEDFGRQIERLINTRGSGEQPSPVLSVWLESIPDALRRKLVKYDLIDPHRAAGGKPLSEHLDDFKAAIRAGGHTQKQADQQHMRVKRIFDGCGFTYWTDIRPDRIQRFIHEMQQKDDLSDRTASFYLKACKQFTRWMLNVRRASDDPLHCLKGKGHIIERNRRRALEIKEIAALLTVTETAEECFGMTGHERSLVYRLGMETGLRASELKALTVSNFDFSENVVQLSSAYTKNRKGAVLPLKPETAAVLKEYLASKTPAAQAFNLPCISRISKMIRADYLAAGIDPTDQGCGKLDFHAGTRHTFATLLSASGCSPKTAMDLLRHSDINLTMKTYTHTLRGALESAVKNLPDLTPGWQAQEQQATGTDDSGQGISTNCMRFCPSPGAKDGENRQDLAEGGPVITGSGTDQKTAISSEKPRFSGKKRGKGELGRVGFEPPTHGFSVHCSTN